MRKLLLAAALLWAAPANAAVLTYNYQGQPLVYSGGGYPGPSTPWIGNLVIDESYLPGGSINGQTLSFGWHVFSGQNLDRKSFSVSGPSGVLGYSQQMILVNGIFQHPSFDWSEYGIIEARYNYILWEGYAGVASGNFSITFDALGNAAAWSGMIMLGAGEIDHFTQNGIDRWGWYTQSIGPGTWTLTSTTPVPLPPALLLFGSALGIGGLLGWRRKVNEPAPC